MDELQWPPPRIRTTYCFFRAGESAYQRHVRRIEAAKKHRMELTLCCHAYDVEMTIEGDFWQFKFLNGIEVVWEPFRGLFYLPDRPDDFIKAYDVRQVAFAIGWMHGDRTARTQCARVEPEPRKPSPPKRQRRLALRRTRRRDRLKLAQEVAEELSELRTRDSTEEKA